MLGLRTDDLLLEGRGWLEWFGLLGLGRRV